jgi:hypothetical protein
MSPPRMILTLLEKREHKKDTKSTAGMLNISGRKKSAFLNMETCK